MAIFNQTHIVFNSRVASMAAKVCQDAPGASQGRRKAATKMLDVAGETSESWHENSTWSLKKERRY